MSRRILALLVLAGVALAGVSTAARQNVDDVIAKILAARGGLDKMRLVTTLKQTSHVTFPDQGQATLVTYMKRPDLVRQEMVVAGSTQITAYDGHLVWTVSPLSGMSVPTVLSGPAADEIKAQADIDGPLVDYKAKGYAITLAGTEGSGATQVYHLRIADKDGRVQNCYVNVATGLLVRVVTGDASPAAGRPAAETDLSDYRDVGGFTLPFTVRWMTGGVETATLHVDKVELNVPLDDAMFRMPQGR